MERTLVRIAGKFYKFITSPYSILAILLLITVWFIIGGTFFHFNDQWFFILEATVISITLLMTFVIEYTTHADTKALHEKLDELIKSYPKADSRKAGIERRYKGED